MTLWPSVVTVMRCASVSAERTTASAGSHRPVPQDAIEGTPPSPDLQLPGAPRAVSGGRADDRQERIQYRELVTEVGRRVDAAFEEAGAARDASRFRPDGRVRPAAPTTGARR